MKVFDTACRAILRLYPRQVRQAHGPEMRATLAAVCAHARRRGGRAAAARAAVWELADLLFSVRRARRGEWPVLSGPRTPQQEKRQPLMRSIAHGFLMAFRSLAAARGHAALAAAILAAGVGVNAAVFGIADSLLFNRVPFRDADRYLEIYNQTERGFSYPGFPPALLQSWRAQTDLFDRVEGYDGQSYVLRDSERTEMIAGAIVTPGLFEMLGVRPVHGRLFAPDEGRPGADKVVILSERLHRSHFGGDPAIVGRTIELNDENYLVAGVMPASFFFPYRPQRLWTPFDPSQPPAEGARLDAIARIAPGVPLQQAIEQSAARGGQLARSAGSTDAGARAEVAHRPDTFVRRAVIALMGAVAFLMLIVCANLANLSLSRALTRTRDFALRAALGASRARLIGESMAESLLIGAMGSIAGVAVAALVLKLTIRAMPEAMALSSLNEIDVDWRVLAFTGLAGLTASVLFGLAPAVLGSRAAVAGTLKDESRSSTGSRGTRPLRAVLIVAEVSLSVVLLVGAALMARSFVKLASMDYGFDPKNLIAMQIGLPSNGYAGEAERQRFIEDLLTRARALPDVQAATAGGIPPNYDGVRIGGLEVEDRPGEVGPETFIPLFEAWPGHFEATGIRIVAGRPFGDVEPSTNVIVNEGFAREHWPNEQAVGKRFRWDGRPWQTIIGVSAEVRQTGVDDESSHEMFVPKRTPPRAAASPPRGAIASYETVLVRAARPAVVLPLLRAAVRDTDPRVALSKVEMVDDQLGEAIALPRMILMLMAVFGAMALMLSAAGIYGVLSMSVVQRLREIGVRLALGATPRDVGGMILRQGAALTAIGLATGFAGSLYVLRFVRTLLYEVEPFDLASMAAVALLLGGVALAAAWRPARRAMKVDPIALLRSQ